MADLIRTVRRTCGDCPSVWYAPPLDFEAMLCPACGHARSGTSRAVDLSPAAASMLRRLSGTYWTVSRRARRTLAIAAELHRAGLVTIEPHANREIKIAPA